jgi:hypothetical protein
MYEIGRFFFMMINNSPLVENGSVQTATDAIKPPLVSTVNRQVAHDATKDDSSSESSSSGSSSSESDSSDSSDSESG